MWKAITRSAIGTRHQAANLPCQDYGAYRLLNQDILIGAIADGAGSAKNADIGAKVAVEQSLNFLQSRISSPNSLTEEQAQSLFYELGESVRSQLSQTATQMKGEFKDLAATLLVFIASPDAIAAMQIGDGFIVTRSPTGEYELLFQPDKGEYINETTFVTSDQALEALQVKVLQTQSHFICAATDGVERVSLNLSQWKPFSPFFEPLEAYLQETHHPEQEDTYLKDFLNSDRLNARTTDDKTLLLSLWCPVTNAHALG
ncbi:MAG: PP2C family serine/threonine-protein phosphatase [Snowella sp.]|nr:PP2C family serine/threonine-protein phosphatase [Snowella sp.]